MSYNVIEIAHPARLSVRDAQLIIEREGYLPVPIPILDIASLLIAHPQVTMTQAVLSRLAESGAIVVTINNTYQPTAISTPIQANSLQTERIQTQVELGQVLRKRLWAQIIRAKIRAQGKLLEEIHQSHAGLIPMAGRVRSGDPNNLEAQAARKYWGLLFQPQKFHRGSDPILHGPDQNRHLDYGYTVLRATVARAVCAAGLHPSIGLHHANRYDNFALVSDMMEPFRPIIDRRVSFWVKEHDPSAPLDSAAKKWLIESVTMRYWFNGEQRTLSDILNRTAISLVDVLAGRSEKLDLPEELVPCPSSSYLPPIDPCGS